MMGFEAVRDIIKNHTRDELFGSLLKYLDKQVRNPEKCENVLDNYMYMIHSEAGYEYKHHASRGYIFVSEEGELLEGRVDLRGWKIR